MHLKLLLLIFFLMIYAVPFLVLADKVQDEKCFGKTLSDDDVGPCLRGGYNLGPIRNTKNTDEDIQLPASLVQLNHHISTTCDHCPTHDKLLNIVSEILQKSGAIKPPFDSSLVFSQMQASSYQTFSQSIICHHDLFKRGMFAGELGHPLKADEEVTNVYHHFFSNEEIFDVAIISEGEKKYFYQAVIGGEQYMVKVTTNEHGTEIKLFSIKKKYKKEKIPMPKSVAAAQIGNSENFARIGEITFDPSNNEPKRLFLLSLENTAKFDSGIAIHGKIMSSPEGHDVTFKIKGISEAVPEISVGRSLFFDGTLKELQLDIPYKLSFKNAQFGLNGDAHVSKNAEQLTSSISFELTKSEKEKSELQLRQIREVDKLDTFYLTKVYFPKGQTLSFARSKTDTALYSVTQNTIEGTAPIKKGVELILGLQNGRTETDGDPTNKIYLSFKLENY